MNKVVCKWWAFAIVCGAFFGTTETFAIPRGYPSPTPGAVEPGLRQERYIDPIDIERLLQFVPSNLRASAKRDFISWNVRLRNAPTTFAKKYTTAQNSQNRDKFERQAFQERKALAFDKLALFERYRIGRFFFAPGAKTVTARVKYLEGVFNLMEPKKGPPVSLSALFPNTSSYLATIGVGSSNLLQRISGGLVECAHAEEGCPPAGSPKNCDTSQPSCAGISKSGASYKPADGSASINLLEIHGIVLGCANDAESNTFTRGGTVVVSVYEVAETYYVCADPAKNVAKSPRRALLAKINVDAVACNDGSGTLRNLGVYAFESGIEDAPIPDGCVGINKVVKSNRSLDFEEGSYVILNAAPCWEKHWECRYNTSPIDKVSDTTLMKDPGTPSCPNEEEH